MTTAPTPHLRALAEAAKDWASCNEAWPDPEDIYVAVVGGIMDGEHYPVAQIEADNCGTDGESLKLAQFYAAANPGAVLALLGRLDALQADNERMRSELEARKPLPLSVERLDELWDSQRSFHGGEPLKMGHVEFARLIEVEYGVLGRIPMREENGGQIDHSLIASREVVADGPVRVTRLHLTDEGRAGLTSKAAGPLPGITGGSS